MKNQRCALLREAHDREILRGQINSSRNKSLKSHSEETSRISIFSTLVCNLACNCLSARRRQRKKGFFIASRPSCWLHDVYKTADAYLNCFTARQSKLISRGITCLAVSTINRFTLIGTGIFFPKKIFLKFNNYVVY